MNRSIFILIAIKTKTHLKFDYFLVSRASAVGRAGSSVCVRLGTFGAEFGMYFNAHIIRIVQCHKILYSV